MAGDGTGDGVVASGDGGAADPVTTAATAAPVAAGAVRPVQVSISIAAPVGSSVPQALQRSSRQIASAVRRAIGPY